MQFQFDAKASQAEVPSVDNAKGIEKNLHPAAFDTDRPSMAALAKHSHDIDVCQLNEVCADPHVRPEYVNMRQQVLAVMMGALRKTDLQLHLLQARKYSLGKPPLYESSSWRRQTSTPAPRCHGEPLRQAASRRGPSHIQISARLCMIVFAMSKAFRALSRLVME